MSPYSNYTISHNVSALDALKKLNENQALTLFLTDSEGRVNGSLTDGDIRRGLINGLKIDDTVSNFCHKEFLFIDQNSNQLNTLRKAKKAGIRILPIVNEEKKLVKIVDLHEISSLLPVDAVFMAGGRGERLRPLTDTTPKPLLPLGDKPIIEHNIDRLKKFGIDNLHICIRYLGEQIIDRFGNGEQKGLSINYTEEKEPLGTIGAVSLINHFNNDTILVMNSDLFTNINLEEFYDHFTATGSDISVATIAYNHSVPYAVMQTEGNDIISFQEKPNFTYMSNAGIYLIKRSILEQIPRNTRLDATDLLQQLIDKQKKVTYFPIMGYWIDIGRPEDYKKAKEFLKYLA